jgi:hypothetical protein
MTGSKTLVRTARWGLLAALGWFASASQLPAQQAELDRGIAPQAATKKAQRPTSSNPKVKQVAALPEENAGATKKPPANYKMPAEIIALLPQWEEESSQIKRLDGKFILTKYDQVFQTETKANGEFWYEAPDKGRMDFKPYDISKCPKDPKRGCAVNPKKVGPNGLAYEVKAHADEQWICTGEKILQIQVEEELFRAVAIQAQYRGESIKNSPLPFLFGLSEEEARQRYLLSLGTFHNQKVAGCEVPVYHIVALPLRAEDASEWSRAEVLLRSDNFLPFSIRTLDPPGTVTNVYTFTGLNVNKRWILSNPFNVSTRGLQEIQSEEASPPPAAAGKSVVKPAMKTQPGKAPARNANPDN